MADAMVANSAVWEPVSVVAAPSRMVSAVDAAAPVFTSLTAFLRWLRPGFAIVYNGRCREDSAVRSRACYGST